MKNEKLKELPRHIFTWTQAQLTSLLLCILCTALSWIFMSWDFFTTTAYVATATYAVVATISMLRVHYVTHRCLVNVSDAIEESSEYNLLMDFLRRYLRTDVIDAFMRHLVQSAARRVSAAELRLNQSRKLLQDISPQKDAAEQRYLRDVSYERALLDFRKINRIASRYLELPSSVEECLNLVPEKPAATSEDGQSAPA